MGQSKKGQIVVEYVLLLLVSVTVAILITQQMVSRQTGSEGFLILKWQQLIQFIADDKIEAPDYP